MARDPAVRLAPGVWRIPLVRDFVNGFILRDDDGQVTLVDMGLKPSGAKVMAALAWIGSGPSDVTRLMLTHAHPDHAGGAAYVAKETGREFGLHEADADFVRRGVSPPRDQRFLLGRLLGRSKNGFAPVPVGETFTDGQVIPFAGGIRVVHTPGHSPGHASYLLQESGVLITGDAIFNVRGLRWPIKAFCTDFAMTQQTAVRLAELEYSTAAFTHGPELRDRPREHIRRFLQEQGEL
jgi:glyoxylase-like metal-dependent hydrolase (beta-lactamase superfamily II)